MEDKQLLYHHFIRRRSHINPCIGALTNYVEAAPKSPGNSCILEYSADNASPPIYTFIAETDLPRAIEAKTASSAAGMVLLVENISPGLVVYLGSLLDIDPLFFAGHVNTDFKEIEKAPLPPSLALFPSHIAERGYLHIHYQQVIDLGSAEQFKHSAYVLKTGSNIPRNTRRLPPLSGRQLALTRGCCSVLLKPYKKSWVGKSRIKVFWVFEQVF